MKNDRILKISLLILFLIVLSFRSGSTNDLIADAGKITTSGTLLPEGNLTIIIYDAATGGNAVYNENFSNNITDGYFDIILGNHDVDLNLEPGITYYKEMYVNEQLITWDTGNRIPFNFPLLNGSISNGSDAHFGYINVSDLNITNSLQIPCIEGEYIDGSGSCKDLNTSIDERVASTTYLPWNISTIKGTLTVGNITSVQTASDGSVYNVTEASGADPLVIVVNFTDVDVFNQILLRVWYEGGLGHEIAVGLYDPNNDIYEEEYGEITDQAAFQYVKIDVLDGGDHRTADGNVSLRFRHEQNGIPSHIFSIDYSVVIQGLGGVSTTEHDGLSGRDDKENHPWAFPVDGSRNITGTVYMKDLFTGVINGSIGCGNITATSGDPCNIGAGSGSDINGTDIAPIRINASSANFSTEITLGNIFINGSHTCYDFPTNAHCQTWNGSHTVIT